MVIKPKGDYINGKFVRSRHPDGEIPSVDPGDSEIIIGDFPVHASAPTDSISAARAAYASWSSLETRTRVASLQKIRAELRNRFDDLVGVISSETGRPLWETRDEVRSMHGELDGLLQASLAELSLCSPPPGECRVTFRPIGVVAVLSPYPQPALLMHLDAVSAMAAGCTVICKPSELTPATAQIYAEIIHEADLPRGVFNLIQGDATVGAALAADPEVDGVLFCGSAENGRRLLQSLEGRPHKTVRTLVSDSATALVLDDARLDEAAYQIVIGACITSGQRCSSTRRVVVHRRIADSLAERLVYLMQNLKVGYSSNPDSFMGPLISAQVMEDYLEHLKRIGLHGGEELVHGAPLSSRKRGFYVTPSIHRMTPEAMIAACEEETSGPLLILSEFTDLDEGMDLVNENVLGLVTSVFSRSEGALDLVRRGHTGPSLMFQNLPTTTWSTRLPLHPRYTSWGGLPAGVLTARTCTRLAVDVKGEGAMDITMLPPGLPRALG